ncbi:MAG: lipopolysaccharide biosynthesis protein, partial [Solirubrobacterales bacterium]
KTAGFLTIGVGLTGVITYLYFAVASHTLSKVDYGEIAVVWSAVFITVSTLYRPVDQLLSRHISERRTRGEPIGQPVRVAAIIQLGLGVAFGILALAFREPLQDDLLSGNETLYWVFFSAVLGYAASYFARGFLAGERQFGLFSILILAESIFRTAFAVAVAVGLFEGQSVVALGIVAAPCLSLVVVPLAFARRARTESAPEPQDPEAGEGAAPEFSLAHGTGFAAAVLLIMLSEQVFLNAGPLLIRATEGAAAAGFIFNVLMVARAPLQLFQAVSTSILPHLTGLHHSEEESSEEAFHHSIRMVLLAIAAFTAAVALAVLALGPQLMQLAFGENFDYDRLGLLIVTFGMGLYLSSVTINQACLAQGQVRRASLRWIGCAAFFVAWCLLPLIGDEFRRVEIGFTATAGALLAILYVIYRYPHERPEDVPDPGSSEELEGLIAAADEAG